MFQHFKRNNFYTFPEDILEGRRLRIEDNDFRVTYSSSLVSEFTKTKLSRGLFLFALLNNFGLLGVSGRDILRRFRQATDRSRHGRVTSYFIHQPKIEIRFQGLNVDIAINNYGVCARFFPRFARFPTASFEHLRISSLSRSYTL